MALITCPDCHRDVSDIAPACPGCGRPIAAAAAAGVRSQPPGSAAPGVGGGSLLPSNIGGADVAVEPRRRTPRGLPVAAMLAALLVLVGGAAVAMALLSNARASAPRVASAAPTLVATLVPTLATTAQGSRRAASAAAAVPLPNVNGISCDALESTLFHIHTHLSLFVDGEEQSIPFGVGIGQPWVVSDSPEGPFVDDGSCFYWVHSHTGDGVLHIESPVRRAFTLGDFFAIWQVPLSATQLGPIQGTVIAYVDGSRADGDPAAIPLTSHGQIQLDIGQDVPPYFFRFPPGT